MPFTYIMFNKECSSVLEQEQAEQIADLFEARAVSPYSLDLAKMDRATGEAPLLWETSTALVWACSGLPTGWQLDVSHVLNERRRAALDAAKLEATQAIEHAGIRQYALDRLARKERGATAPKGVDLSFMARLSSQDQQRESHDSQGRVFKIGKPSYKPEPGCDSRLQLRAALALGYIQDSYADLTLYAVPAAIGAGSDRAVCNRNLQSFCEALRTHTGTAGSGATWDATLHGEGAEAFVVFNCRASIAD